eukprot:scaffold3540_cov379-Prasinococcus_capsulatus_cf.AAC.9
MQAPASSSSSQSSLGACIRPLAHGEGGGGSAMRSWVDPARARQLLLLVPAEVGQSGQTCRARRARGPAQRA